MLVGVDGPLDALNPWSEHRKDNEDGGQLDVDEKQQEVLTVPEADAVVDPRAVMVHVEHASVAGGAVMAPLGLEDVAHEAVAATLVLRVSQVEAPEDWDLPGVCCH